MNVYLCVNHGASLTSGAALNVARRQVPQNGSNRNDYQCQQSPYEHTLHASFENQAAGTENFNIGCIYLHVSVYVLQMPTTSSISKMKNCIRHGRYKGASRVPTLSCVTCLPPNVMLTVTRNNMQLIELIINIRRFAIHTTMMTCHSTSLSSM